jgi:hypothetical protein
LETGGSENGRWSYRPAFSSLRLNAGSARRAMRGVTHSLDRFLGVIFLVFGFRVSSARLHVLWYSS